ncbi:MAG: type II secretion system F family protein [Thermoclostridium sp.]|nr:type II secretion system F family protein [Thermoclostridium sp.]
MPVYSYESYNKQGETVKGVIGADSVSECISTLKSMGLTVLDLKEQKRTKFSAFLSSEKKVTMGELSIFSKQLSAMISSGIPITRSLYTLSKQNSNPTLKSALEDIAKNVESGMSISDSFAAYPRIFPDIYIAMVQSGEVGGVLETTLKRLSVQLQKEKQLKDNIKSATFYPRMLMGVALLLTIVMIVFLVPVFKSFIPEGAPIPGVTQVVFGLSDSIRTRWYFWIAGAVALAAAVMTFIKSKRGRLVWERLKFKMPIFGDLIQKSVIARFSRTLSTLMEGGIPVVQALQSAGPTAGNIMVAEAVNEAIISIEEGKSISGPLEASEVFPPMVTQMIAIGEESGSMPSMLDTIAEFYEDEVATLTKGLSSLIEPIMLVTVGLVVGGMLISLYLPIFTSITSSGY